MRLLVVDDHSVFRESLALVLGHQPDVEVAAQAGTLAEARRAIRELGDGALDLALLDLDLPDGNGAELVEDLQAADPAVPALVLTAFVERGRLADAVEAGALGVLNKACDLAEILDAIRRLGRGEEIMPTDEVVRMVRLAAHRRRQDRDARAALSRLTPRELEVLQALADGLNDREIAQRLHVGAGTVRSHLTSVLSKLGVASRLQALVFALRHGAAQVRPSSDE